MAQERPCRQCGRLTTSPTLYCPPCVVRICEFHSATFDRTGARGSDAPPEEPALAVGAAPPAGVATARLVNVTDVDDGSDDEWLLTRADGRRCACGVTARQDTHPPLCELCWELDQLVVLVEREGPHWISRVRRSAIHLLRGIRLSLSTFRRRR